MYLSEHDRFHYTVSLANTMILYQMKKNVTLATCFLFYLAGYAQQTVKGVVVDQDSQRPIPFAAVVLQDTDPLIGATSDAEGRFRLEGVAVGRHTVVATYVGYEPYLKPNVEVTSGKEVVLTIRMTESFETLDEVVVKTSADKTQNVNELATISTRSLRVEEASRYAASIADPARQAQNFAGVVSNSDDLSNDIVIRGNAPSGLLWRLEGVEIPNPNHFATLGSSGGAVSMLSSNVLATSDFYTGAFPAEYGNATAGVFDLRFRKGNSETRETTVGLGFLGLEVASEGPILSDNNASYLFNYRYSTLSILDNLGVSIAGDFLPSYQDLSFNVSVPTQKLGTVSIFGLGGNSWSNTTFKDEQNAASVEIADEKSSTAVLGVKHVYFLAHQGYLQSVIVASRQRTDNKFDTKQNQVVFPDLQESFRADTYRLSTLYNRKFSSRHTFQTGMILSSLQQRLKNQENVNNQLATTEDWRGRTLQLQAYTHWKWRIRERLTLNTGLHYLYYALNAAGSVEPRIGLRWEVSDKNSFSVGGGLHSRTENLVVYLVEGRTSTGAAVPRNRELRLAKSAHVVLGFDQNIRQNTRLKVEAYYQRLYDVPVSQDTAPTFSALNATDIFGYLQESNIPLVSQGVGRNYGLEITLERFLRKGFYYLTTLSLYQSEFSLNRKQYFSTRFNGNYIANVLAGKEFQMGKSQQNTFGINVKFVLSGGQRYTAVDIASSNRRRETVFSDNLFAQRLSPYYRLDVGLNYRWNLSKSSHTISLNVQNVTNHLNEFRPDTFFNEQTNRVVVATQQQSGLIPILKYSFNF